MDREEVIKLAQEAGFDAHDMSADFTCNLIDIERFAALVAAAEREACAVIAETPISGEQDDITMEAKDRAAAAIRARGEKA